MTTITLHHTLTIARPVREVFSFMEIPGNMPKWAESVIEAEQTSDGPVGVGTTCRIVNSAMGQTFNAEFVVTEYERDRIYAVESTSAPFPMRMRYVVESEDGGTRLSVRSEAQMDGMAGMAAPFLRGKAQRRIEDDHARLKHLLESGA